MTVSVVNAAGTTTSATAGTIVVSMPASVISGDLLVVFIACSTSGSTWTSSGWTAFDSSVILSSGDVQGFYKTATGSEGSTQTFTINSGSHFEAALSIAFRGQSATTSGFDPGIPTSSGTANASSTNVTAPGVTLNKAGDILLWVGVCTDGTGATVPPTFTQPTGYSSQATSHFTGSSISNMGMMVATITGASSGVTGDIVGTIGSAETNLGFLVGIASGSLDATIPAVALATNVAISTPTITVDEGSAASANDFYFGPVAPTVKLTVPAVALVSQGFFPSVSPTVPASTLALVTSFPTPTVKATVSVSTLALAVALPASTVTARATPVVLSASVVIPVPTLAVTVTTSNNLAVAVSLPAPMVTIKPSVTSLTLGVTFSTALIYQPGVTLSTKATLPVPVVTVTARPAALAAAAPLAGHFGFANSSGIALVQQKVFTGANSGSLSVASTAGNTIVVAYAGSAGAGSTGTCSVTGITFGGVQLAKQVEQDDSASASASCSGIWMLVNIPGGQMSVVVSGTGLTSADAYFVIYEISGLGNDPSLDVSSSGPLSAGTTTWSSDTGSAPTTNFADEFWVGITAHGPNSANDTLGGPDGPWINASRFAWSEGSAVAGYTIASSTGSLRYNGTSADSDSYTAVVAAFQPGTAATATPAALVAATSISQKPSVPAPIINAVASISLPAFKVDAGHAAGSLAINATIPLAATAGAITATPDTLALAVGIDDSEIEFTLTPGISALALTGSVSTPGFMVTVPVLVLAVSISLPVPTVTVTPSLTALAGKATFSTPTEKVTVTPGAFALQVTFPAPTVVGVESIHITQPAFAVAVTFTPPGIKDAEVLGILKCAVTISTPSLALRPDALRFRPVIPAITFGPAQYPPWCFMTSDADTNEFGGSFTDINALFAGTATDASAGIAGTEANANPYLGEGIVGYGGAEADTNKYGGSVTETNLYGGSQSDGNLPTLMPQDVTFGEFNDEVINLAVFNNAVPFNLTGYGLAVYLKVAAGRLDTDPSTIVLSTAGDNPNITITNASAGLAQLIIPHAELDVTNITFWRCDVTDGDFQATALYGDVTILAL